MKPDSPCDSAGMNPEELKAFLLGGWQLRSYVLSNVVDGSVRHPLGRFPLGRLVYTADDQMGVQIMDCRPSTDPTGPAESVGVVGGYLAYSGTYQTQPGAIVRHFPVVSNYGNWVGSELNRRVQRQSFDEMELVTSQPVVEHGARFMGLIQWRRASAFPSLTF